MKKTVSLLLMLLLLSGAAYGAKKPKKPSGQDTGSGPKLFMTYITDNSAAWPSITRGYIYYEPSEVSSEEEAISNLRSSQGYISVRGQKPYDITADRYSAVFKIQWTEESSYQENVPTSGGFFIGWDYIPTYSNTVQTYHTTTQKNDAMSIVFKEVTAIYFFNSTLCIETAGGINYISAGSTAQLKTLADSIYTLAVRNGGKPESGIFKVNALNKDQCEKLNIDAGDFVTSVFADGEADRAGIKEGDVILNLADVRPAGGFGKFFRSGKSLNIIRFTQDGNVISYKKLHVHMKGGK